MPYKKLVRQDIDSSFICHHCGKSVKPDQFCTECQQCDPHCGCHISKFHCRVCEQPFLAGELCECCGRCEGCRACDQELQLQKGA